MPKTNLNFEFLIKILTPSEVKTKPKRVDAKLSFSQDSKNTAYKTGDFQWRILFHPISY